MKQHDVLQDVVAMYSLGIAILGLVPALLFFVLSRFEDRSAGPTPMLVMGWTFLFGQALKSLYLSYAVTSGAPFVGDWIARDIIDLGQMTILLGSVCLAIGYIAGTAILRNVDMGLPRPPQPSINVGPLYWSAFALSLALMIVFFHKMGFSTQLTSLRLLAAKRFIDEESGVRTSLSFLTLGGDFLIVFFLYRVVHGPKLQAWDLHMLSVAFCGLCYLLSSRRNGVMIMVILYLLVSGHRKITSARPRLGLNMKRWIVLALLVIALSFAGQIRKGGEKGIDELNLAEAAAITAEHLFRGAYFLDPAKTAAIVQEVSRRNLYAQGATFALFLAAPIPRIVWPEKPNIRSGKFVGQEILDFSSRAGAPPSGFGEFYINFGWLGVMIGSAALGLALSAIWRKHQTSKNKSFSRIRYALALMCVILFLTADFSVAMLAYIKYRAAAALATRYWSAYDRRMASATSENGSTNWPFPVASMRMRRSSASKAASVVYPRP